MENTHKQRTPSSNEKQLRQEEVDIIKGARKTDQLEKMKETAEKHPSGNESKEGTPASVKVNDGKNENPAE